METFPNLAPYLQLGFAGVFAVALLWMFWSLSRQVISLATGTADALTKVAYTVESAIKAIERLALVVADLEKRIIRMEAKQED